MTDRDLALFMELSYRDDHYIQQVLDETKPFYDVYKDRNEYKVINKELAPYWKFSKTYHTENSLDAVLFETRSHLPFLGKQTTHVLAFRGTEPDSSHELVQ